MNDQRRKALITGAGGGIGSAVALRLAEDGFDVAIADLVADSLTDLRTRIEQLGRRAVTIGLDLTVEGGPEKLVSDVANQLGGIDVFVNNAGVTWHKDFFDVTDTDWDRINDVNARAVFFCMQHVARKMVEQGGGGSIINTASIAAKGFRDTSNVAYAASKGSVISMTLIAAHALGEYGITVNAVCPGVTRTPMLDAMLAKRSAETEVPVVELERELADSVPIQRFNEPEDVAALVAFLASPGGRNITGQSINIDGGLVMH